MNPELDEKLSALLDGALAPADAEALRAELGRSPELAERLAALRAVDEELRALPSRPVPAALRARVTAQVRARPSAGRAPRSGAIGARRWLAAAALAAAAATLALLVLPRVPREETQVVGTEPAPSPAPAPPPAPEELAEAEDLPVIRVLDVLAELDELEEVGSG
jgi:anti-sigma factor RsiW